MRISGGYLRGREIVFPNNHRTHPMGERVRSGLFNTLGIITDLSVLDAYAGSGLIGFEAISRGASKVTAIENDHQAQEVIKENIIKLSLTDSMNLVQASATSWLNTTKTNFDVVILDPPYDKIKTDVLLKLSERVIPGGIVVLSSPPNFKLILPTYFKVLIIKNYGDAEISFYKRSRLSE